MGDPGYINIGGILIPSVNKGTITQAGKQAAQYAGGLIPPINWGRLAAFLLGLLLIAGGLYLLKPTQQLIIKPAKRALKSTAEAGEVAAAA